MKNYLYHFEFFSGFYESYFYRQVQAIDEKDAIIQIVSFFINSDIDSTKNYLEDELGKNWLVKKFWDEMDLKFESDIEGYDLIWIKEVDFDLNDIGKFI